MLAASLILHKILAILGKKAFSLSCSADVSRLSWKVSCLSGKSLRTFPVTNSNTDRPEGMRSCLTEVKVGWFFLSRNRFCHTGEDVRSEGFVDVLCNDFKDLWWCDEPRVTFELKLKENDLILQWSVFSWDPEFSVRLNKQFAVMRWSTLR